MNGEWCVFNKNFSKEYCERIIELSNNIPKQVATIGVNGVTISSEYRRSQIAFIQRDMLEFQLLFDDLWKLCCTANNDWFNFHISKFDYIQYAEYSSTEHAEYKRHHDVFYMNNDLKYHRKLSAVVQLSDPDSYTGGELEIYNIDSECPADMFKNQGSVILFPSFTTHAVLPVTRGVRNSLAIWVDGPKWR